MSLQSDTIAAVSTPPGIGGIAVIRVSGESAISIFSNIWRGRNPRNMESHKAYYGELVSEDGDTLDQCVATVFRAPGSFTGEDTVEISIHGSEFLQKEVLNRLMENGARIAGPGEFSRRAFMNGRLDITQAEGIADILSASSKAAHRLAVNHLKGNLSKKLNSLRERLLHLASMLELELDFSEEDVEFASRSELKDLTEKTMSEILRLIHSYNIGRGIKEGVSVVIGGMPNAGKSSLLNHLLDEEKAIVTSIPGTTRDLLEDTIELDGMKVRLTDTAGLREADDEVERIGVNRAKDAMSRADLLIWMIDPTENIDDQLIELEKIQSNPDTSKFLVLINKTDLFKDSDIEIIPQLVKKMGDSLAKIKKDDAIHILPISLFSGSGIPEFKKALKEILKPYSGHNEEVLINNLRHKQLLSDALEQLKRVRVGIKENYPLDLVAQDLRQAITYIGEITGAITTDSILTNIFSRFCIGK